MRDALADGPLTLRFGVNFFFFFGTASAIVVVELVVIVVVVVARANCDS